MDVGVTPAKSILAKPLKLLTEDDISQLTREDCRNFLKEKGMRRPSWNKSQAIQQVLSLKALFDPGEDSGAGFLRKILVSQPSIELGACGRIQEDDGSCHRRDSQRSAEFSGGSSQYAAEKDSYKIVSPRSMAETSALDGQMTIFYSGKVNVYDAVTSERARSIMHIAANTIDLPQNGTFASSRTVSNPISKEKMVELPRHGYEKAHASCDSDVEGQANRKVSLQRYLEKRKDRCSKETIRYSKSKKALGVASSSLEMFLNHKPRMNAAYSQNISGTREPRTLCGSPEYQTKSPNLSVDLNSEPNSEDI